MANRVTPVQAAKQLGIRPQVVYGFIKHNRVRTFPNPGGRADLVDFDEVKRIAGSVKPHRAKDPATGKPVRREAKVKRGDILSYHGVNPRLMRDPGPHRVGVVTNVVNNDEGEASLVVTQRDGVNDVYWETERLADRIKNGACHIESTASLLGVVMHAWVAQGEAELAAALQMFCEVNDIEYEAVEIPEAAPVAQPVAAGS